MVYQVNLGYEQGFFELQNKYLYHHLTSGGEGQDDTWTYGGICRYQLRKIISVIKDPWIRLNLVGEYFVGN